MWEFGYLLPISYVRIKTTLTICGKVTPESKRIGVGGTLKELPLINRTFLMIYLYTILALTLFGCQSGNLTGKFLEKNYLDLAKEYEESKEGVLNSINELPEINKEVRNRTLLLDSLFSATTDNIEKNEKPSLALQNFRHTVKSQLFPNNDLGTNVTEELPEENAKEIALIEVTQIAREALKKLASEVGAQDLRFDEVKIFTDIENSLINRGDSLNVRIYFGAYSTNSEKAFDFFADGEKIEIKNGVGLLKIKTENIGQNEIKILVKGSKDSKHWIDIEREETLRYMVK